MINIQPVFSERNVTKLRLLDDKVETHFRGLEAQEVDQTSYSSIVVPAILDKISENVRYNMIRSSSSDHLEWIMKEMLTAFEREMVIHESHTSPFKNRQGTRNQQERGWLRPKREQGFEGTANALLATKNFKRKCVFCLEEDHAPEDCQKSQKWIKQAKSIIYLVRQLSEMMLRQQRFRGYSVSLVGDIEKAFLNIEVDPRDRDCLRFLWKTNLEGDDSDNDISIQQSGANNRKKAFDLYLKAKGRMKERGFRLRKWKTSDVELSQKIKEREGVNERQTGQTCGEEMSYAKKMLGVEKASDSKTKVLGVVWDSYKDNLEFKLSKELCMSKLDWDDAVPREKATIWDSWPEDLSQVNTVTLSRARVAKKGEDQWPKKLEISESEEVGKENKKVNVMGKINKGEVKSGNLSASEIKETEKLWIRDVQVLLKADKDFKKTAKQLSDVVEESLALHLEIVNDLTAVSFLNCLRRFCARREKDLTLDKLLAKGRAFELSDAQATGLEDALSSTHIADEQATVQFVKSNNKRSYTSKLAHHTQQSSKECRNCGGSCPHNSVPCPARGKTYNKCGKSNHFAVICRSASKSSAHMSRSQPRKPQNSTVRTITTKSSADSDPDNYGTASALGLVTVHVQITEEQKTAEQEQQQRPLSLDTLLKRYIDIFNGIGQLKDFKLKLHIDPAIPPVAQSPRKIPFHMR
eukprot:gene2354-biopygen2080